MEKQIIERKKAEVIRITEKMERAVSFFIVDYSGLNANDMNSLRRKFKRSHFEYFVIKNSILERVGDKLGLEEIPRVLTGPNAISISYEDPIGPAKIINDYYKENRLPLVKLCYIEGKWFLADDVKRLAELPPREVLIGQVLNIFNSPISQFVNLLRNVVENFVRVVDAIKDSKNTEEDEKQRENGDSEKKQDQISPKESTEEEQLSEESHEEVKEVKGEKKGDHIEEEKDDEVKEEQSKTSEEETKK